MVRQMSADGASAYAIRKAAERGRHTDAGTSWVDRLQVLHLVD
jgi:hypothetical protein